MFTFGERKIEKVGGDGFWHQVLMDVEVRRDRVFGFKVRVVESANRGIMVGVVDR